MENFTIQEKFLKAREALATSLIERENEIDIVLTSILAKEHSLLVGDPGTAKSHLLGSISQWVKGSTFFPILFNKFTTPEEVFGPISVQSIKEDKYRRITTGMLPEAHFAFGDEIFKASTAILNSLLKILNERLYKNGGVETPCPLLFFLSASNEFPNENEGGKELNALFDRFLFRRSVRNLTKTGRNMLLTRAENNDKCIPVFPCSITIAEIETAHKEAMLLPYHKNTKEVLREIISNLNIEGIKPGDRRVYKSVGAARAYAYLMGGKEVLPEHLEILSSVLWVEPIEQPKKCDKIVAKLANPLNFKIQEIENQIIDVENSATEKLKSTSNRGERESICVQAITELKEIDTDLRILSANARRNKLIDYLEESINSWKYALIGSKR